MLIVSATSHHYSVLKRQVVPDVSIDSLDGSKLLTPRPATTGGEAQQQVASMVAVHPSLIPHKRYEHTVKHIYVGPTI